MGVITFPKVETTREDIALDHAHQDYIAGRIGVERLERVVEAILDGTDRFYTSPFEPFAIGPDPGKRMKY